MDGQLGELIVKTVTALKLQKKNKDRVNVFLDGEYALAVSFNTAATLRKGQQLSAAEIDQLRQDGEENRAYHQALHFLGFRPRSQAEVSKRLKEKEFEAELIQNVLDRLVAEGYVNDEAFARFWVENRTRFRPRSARALRYELRQKGVADAVIEGAVTDLDEEAAAWDALVKQADRWRALDEAAFIQKAVGFLARRGFAYNIAKTAAMRMWHEEYETETWD